MSLQQSQLFTIRVSEIMSREEKYPTGRAEIYYSVPPFTNQEIVRKRNSSTHFTIRAYQPCCHAANMLYGVLFWRTGTATRMLRHFALSAGGWRLSVPTGSTNFSVDSRHLPVAIDNKHLCTQYTFIWFS